MFTVKQIEPPAQFRPEGIGEPTLGVRMSIAPGGAALILTPEHNRVGTQVLSRLLQAALKLAGVHVSQASSAFPLNRAFVWLVVSEISPAQQAVKEELEKLQLLEYAQIAWRDPREQIWRLCYSKSCRFDAPADEEYADERQLFEKILNAANKHQESGDEPSGQ